MCTLLAYRYGKFYTALILKKGVCPSTGLTPFIEIGVVRRMFKYTSNTCELGNPSPYERSQKYGDNVH